MPAELRKGALAEPVVSLPGLPVFCNALYPTAAEALGAPRGDLELMYSPVTGYLWNRAFDPALVAYNPAYENSLHYSPRFATFVESLADRLVRRYDLHGRQIVEIGSGEGNFLALLCERGPNQGIGYDPSFDPSRTKVTTSERMRIVREYYPTDRDVDADLVVCQHVLEHVPDPAGLVEGVRRSLEGRPGAAVYFEMPDATYMVEQLAVWDLIYEHASYFSAPTLAWLFERAGFELTEVDRSFGDQYLYVEARPGSARADAVPDPAALGKLTELVSSFGGHVRQLAATWGTRLAELVGTGRVAVWGAGSKGVTFLNLVDAGRDVAFVVDVNPNKSGLHVPGTGQVVVAPEALRGQALDTVLVMNPLYVDEIRRIVTDLGSNAQVIAISG
ncbi:MAG: methyltransferase domain-containing protein [Acidimicrobiia bacterium]|nr:methyltransferase domain-containing protein [Acidimicrobiia bacterium]